MWGVFTFTPSVRRLLVGNATVILQPFRVQLRNGHLENVNILAPDVDPVEPPDWIWTIRQRVGPNITEYAVPVPLEGDTIDVKDLIPGGEGALPLSITIIDGGGP